MKKMSPGRISFFVLIVALTAAACSKPKDGTNGTNGTNGAQGPAGTANVVYSAWLSVPFTLASDSSAYLATITVPKLVDSIIEKGDIKVYINVNTPAAPAVSPLPYSESYFTSNSTSITYSCYPVFQVGKITLVGNVDFSTYTNSGSTYFQYRYVFIPGGVAGRSAINWNDYQQVKQYLGLKD